MIKRAGAYFVLVFGAGFILGTIRVIWVLPLLGERRAELIEMPLMLAAIRAAALFVVRRYPAARRSDHLASGCLALGVLLGVEFTVVLALRGLTLQEYVATRDPISGTVYLGLLIVFACMPWWVAPRVLARTASRRHGVDPPQRP